MRSILGLSLALILFAGGGRVLSEESSATIAGIALGRWEGSADLGSGEEPMVLRVLEAGGLLDLPARAIFGFPLAYFERGPGHVSFSMTEPNAEGPGAFDAVLSPPEQAEAASIGATLKGKYRGADDYQGSFELSYVPEAGRGEAYPIDTGRAPYAGPEAGRLPGTLLLPEGGGNGIPVALLLSGAGPVDRDGNNYAVPGKCDSLKALAEALAERGIASLRYDKRGSGEAYALVRREEDLLFGDYIADAVDALRVLASDGRFSAIVAVGYGEGALVAAAALADFLERGLAVGSESRFRLTLLCASGETAQATLERELAALPSEQKAEAAAIMESLSSGKLYNDPSPVLADFFRPSIQPYLASTFRYDIAAELGRTSLPVLLVQGGRDTETNGSGIERIVAAHYGSRAVVLPDMGRALKELGPDPEEAYRAYSDPSLLLAEGLGDLLAAFARGDELPRPAGGAEGPADAAVTAPFVR